VAVCFVTTIKSTQETVHWAALWFQYCINLEITNVYIYNSVGYGISADNVIGNNSLKSVTVVMGRDNEILGTCSRGVKWSYDNLYGKFIETYDNIVLSIDNIIIKQHTGLQLACVNTDVDRSILKLELNKHTLHVDIKNSNFSKLNGRILNVKVSSASHSHVNIYKCSFVQNSAQKLINFQQFPYIDNTTKNYAKSAVFSFWETVFHTTDILITLKTSLTHLF